MAASGKHRGTGSRWWPVLGAAIFIVGAALRLWSLGRNGWQWDEAVYRSVASNIAMHDLYAVKPEYGQLPQPYFYQPPFYFLLLGGWFKLVGIGFVQERLFAALVSLAAIGMLFFFVKGKLGLPGATAASACILFDGWMIYTNRTAWIENSLLVFVVGALWLYDRALRKPATGAFVIAGTVLAAATVYKHIGGYAILVVCLNWFITRKDGRGRGQLLMLATAFAGMLLYGAVMLLIYKGVFWHDTLVQLKRTFGVQASRGTLNDPSDVIRPLINQYRVFVTTIVGAGIAFAVMAWRIVEGLTTRSWAKIKENSLFFAWGAAALGGFAAIALRFPHYYIMVAVPLYVYLVSEGVYSDRRSPRAWRLWLFTAIVVIVAIGGLFAFGMRIVAISNSDQALQETAAFMQEHVPHDAVVIADQPVGSIIPQPYCNPFRLCPQAKYLITYASDTQQLPNTPGYQELLKRTVILKEITGYKERISIRKIVGSPAKNGP